MRASTATSNSKPPSVLASGQTELIHGVVLETPSSVPLKWVPHSVTVTAAPAGFYSEASKQRFWTNGGTNGAKVNFLIVESLTELCKSGWGLLCKFTKLDPKNEYIFFFSLACWELFFYLLKENCQIWWWIVGPTTVLLYSLFNGEIIYVERLE